MANATRSVLKNQPRGRVLIHFSANAGNLSNTFSLANTAVGGEQVDGLSIRQVWWGTQNAASHWHVNRGTNTAVILSATGSMNFADQGNALTFQNNETLVLTLSGGEGFIMVEAAKITPNSVYTYA